MIAFVLGYKDGFVRKLIGTIAFAIAIYLSILFARDVGSMLNSALGMEIYLANMIGGFLIFTVIMIVSSILKRVFHPFDRVNNLINRLVGGIVGFLQFLVFLSALFYILGILNYPPEYDRKTSVFYEDIYNIIPSAIDYLEDYTPKAKDFINDYFDKQDTL